MGGKGLLLASVAGFFALNFVVQIVRKPTEILRFAGLGRGRSPGGTWSEFGADCLRYEGGAITAEYLAALIQVESSGDRFAAPPWRWRWSLDPWRVYAPPSSAVGVLQITKGNLGAARSMVGRDDDSDGCAIMGQCIRLIGSDSIAMTSAFLQSRVRASLAGQGRQASVRDKQVLAAVIHLCGPNKGPALVRANFDPDSLGTCGGQSVGSYVRLVMKYREQFSRLALVDKNQAARARGSGMG
ncbi:MAG: lytic transglycosylase domain-containing protein [Elusimicrobiota bacterium]